MTALTRRLLTIALLALAFVVGLSAPDALADKLHLKDGRVLEGHVQREGEGFVYFVIVVGSIEHTELFTTEQIVRIERDKPAQGTADPGVKAVVPSGAGAVEGAKKEAPSSDGATRIAFISLEDEVGLLMNGKALVHSAELIKDEKPDVVVLVINSGGGSLAEVEPLSDAIHETLKSKYRVVAWIRSAISAAAMTAVNCEEIYMMKEGNLGGAVAFMQTSGGNKSVEGEELEQILKLGEELARRGKRNPLVVRAMQVFMNLSCDVDENGVITWYDSTKGKYLVNPKDRILTFNSQDAQKYGVSKGTAETKEELIREMGIEEWVEVGHKADEYQKEFRASVKELQARANELLPKLKQATDAAAGSPTKQDKARFVGKARSILAELRSLVRRAPSFEKYTIFRPEWFEEREEELKKLAAPPK